MSNDFADIFEQTSRFLEARGVTPVISPRNPAAPDTVKEFRDATGIDLPRSFLSFYTDFSDGYSFEWEEGPEDEDQHGAFIMPTLEELAALHRTWLETVHEDADDPESMNDSIEPEFRPAAYRIMEGMKSWLPFIEEEETGDAFCVSLPDGKVVFNKMDWFDGFGRETGTNGLVAGNSLMEFVQTWSRYSFMTMWFADSPHDAGMTEVTWDAQESEFVRG